MSTELEDIRFDPPPPRLAWIETVAITLLVPAIGFLAHREDPMFIQGPFPWLIVAPMLAGMRYGFLFGFSSALIATAMLALGWRFRVDASVGFPYEYALAAFLTGMLAGEFADGWLRRLARLQIVLDYRVSRQAEFTRSYHLLKVSHDQLEERIAGTRYSLRNALIDLRKNLALVASDALVEQNAVRILEFLEAHSDVQRAALYGVTGNNEALGAVLARIGGEPGNSLGEHPMIRDCLSSGRLVSVRLNAFKNADREDERNLLAAIPLVDSDGRIWGLVAVFEMPFISFNDDNLNLLAALGASIGDFLADSAQESGGRTRDHAVWFAAKLERWTSYAKRYQISSMLAAVGIGPELRKLPPEARVDRLLFGQMRGLDEGVVLDNRDGGMTILVLMPLADSKGFDGYRKRMMEQIVQRLAREPSARELTFRSRELRDARDADDLMTQLHEEAQRALV